MNFFKKKIDKWGRKHILHEWNMVKEYFIPPVPVFYFGKIASGLGGGRFRWKDWYKLIQVFNYDVTWKDKYNDPRYEFPPQINIIFFHKFQFLVRWFPTPDKPLSEEDMYWETILTMTHYRKTLKEAVEECTWEDIHKNKSNVYTQNLLTYKGKEIYELPYYKYN